MVIVFSFDIQADGTQLAAGCIFGRVAVWQYSATGSMVLEENYHSSPVEKICWNPYNKNVFATYSEKNVSLKPFFFCMIHKQKLKINKSELF